MILFSRILFFQKNSKIIKRVIIFNIKWVLYNALLVNMLGY